LVARDEAAAKLNYAKSDLATEPLGTAADLVQKLPS
jgi:hypothetical protein